MIRPTKGEIKLAPASAHAAACRQYSCLKAHMQRQIASPMHYTQLLKPPLPHGHPDHGDCANKDPRMQELVTESTVTAPQC